MKKFTIMLLATFVAVTSFAQKQLAKAEMIAKEANELRQTQIQARGVSRSSTTTRQKSPRKSLGLVTPPTEATPETYYTASGKLMVYTGDGWKDGGRETIQVIVDGSDIYIAGLAYWLENAWIKGTIDGTTATFPAAQQVDDDASYPEWISGSDDGETICDVVFNFDQVAGVLECTTTYIGECSAEDAFNVYAYWNQPIFTKDQPVAPEVVVLPDGLEILPYAMIYDEGSKGINVAVDGNDVYFQGMSKYCPEAWVKGTKEGNFVTFPAMQYMGDYVNYGSSFFFYNGETTFTYDPDAGTYTAEGLVFGVLADQYYDGKYTNPVLSPVVEKAVMPANPEITEMEETTNSGWVVDFNIPLMDVNGDPLVDSKLTYMIYTDTEGTIAPLTFTPATHTYLTDDMTEIPYGFTENYDFYATYIYLNELYSEDWNKIGIQSIYRGGGEENITEIQWFDIKPYKVQSYTFDFNAMDVATSSNVTTDGDITETYEQTEGNVTLAISPKDEEASTPNRFWGTSAGPQLRVYSGTLTFSVPTGYGITQIVFNHNGKWGANTINGVEIANDAEAKVATWTLAEGEEPASVVVVAIAANSQINSIDVTVEATGNKLVVLPEGVEPEAWALEGFYSDGSDGQNVFHATEVAFDGTDIYVKGLAYWFEDAWLKGTLEAETGIVTFPSGQFVGEDDYGQEYMVGFDGSDFCDIQYEYDAEAKTLTQVTPFILESESKSGLDEEGEIAFWGRWEVSYLHAGAPTALEIVEVPEGLVTETYAFNANEWVEESEAAVETSRMKAPRKAMVSQPYSHQMQVGFDGKDVYFKSFSDDTADMWAKGTLSDDGKTVTIPASQYLGFISSLASTSDYYVTAVNEYYENVDIVLNYDADTNTFTTDQTIVLNGSMFVYYPYQTFTDVTIAKMAEFAATPADPSIDGYKFEDVSFPYINFAIPTTDVDGNDILASKLFYTVWIEEDGEEKPFVVLADEYKYVEEDWTEIPYEWDDQWDIYKGGSKFYINPTDAIKGWTKYGIQSIYYGGGERHVSNIVWSDGSKTKTVVMAPADLVTETYSFDGFDLDYSANTTRQVEVGFYGENEVYIQGLSEYLPNAWVKGSLEGNTLTIPETYLGTYTESDGEWSENYKITFSGATFTYDGEIGTFYSEDGYVTDDNPDDEIFYDRFKYITLTKLPDYATTPINPDIFNFDYLDVDDSYVKFNIPAVSALDGGTLIKNKLYYQFYYYKDLEVVPLVLTKDLYPELDADMSEIPYGFSKQGLVYMDILYLRQPKQEIDSWYMIGLQSIYYGGGERNTSEIVWWTNPTPDGIQDLKDANDSEAAIYNLAGQRLNKTAKGVNIVNGKKVLR